MTKGKWYLALQAVVCVALVALIAVSAVGIYREGSARKAEHCDTLENLNELFPGHAEQHYRMYSPL